MPTDSDAEPNLAAYGQRQGTHLDALFVYLGVLYLAQGYLGKWWTKSGRNTGWLIKVDEAAHRQTASRRDNIIWMRLATAKWWYSKWEGSQTEDKVVEAEKEECWVVFRVELRQALGVHEELPDDWTTTANMVRATGGTGLGESSRSKHGQGLSGGIRE